MNYRVVLHVVCLVALLAAAANAELILTLDNPNQIAVKGTPTVLHYTGTITNTFDYDLRGRGAGAIIPTLNQFPGTWFSEWQEASFTLWPEPLKAGQTYRGEIFTLFSNGSDGLGRYDGKFEVNYNDAYYGGPSARSEYLDISVTVAVPEPGSLMALALGLSGLGAVAWRKIFLGN